MEKKKTQKQHAQESPSTTALERCCWKVHLVPEHQSGFFTHRNFHRGRSSSGLGLPSSTPTVTMPGYAVNWMLSASGQWFTEHSCHQPAAEQSLNKCIQGKSDNGGGERPVIHLTVPAPRRAPRRLLDLGNLPGHAHAGGGRCSWTAGQDGVGRAEGVMLSAGCGTSGDISGSLTEQVWGQAWVLFSSQGESQRAAGCTQPVPQVKSHQGAVWHLR